APPRKTHQEAVRVHRTGYVKRINVRAGVSIEFQEPATRVLQAHDRCHSHVEPSIGLCLTVQTGEAVNQSRKDVSTLAVNCCSILGDLHYSSGPSRFDFAVADDHNSIGDVVRTVTKVGDID